MTVCPSPTEGRLGCFQFGAITNKAAVTVMCKFLRAQCLNQWSKFLGVGLLDCVLRLCLALQEVAEMSFKVAVLITGNDEFLLLCLLVINGQPVVCLNFNHSKRCRVIFHCCLICNSLITNDVECIFICLFVNSISGETSVQIFCPLFNEIVCYLTIFL